MLLKRDLIQLRRLSYIRKCHLKHPTQKALCDFSQNVGGSSICDYIIHACQSYL